MKTKNTFCMCYLCLCF